MIRIDNLSFTYANSEQPSLMIENLQIQRGQCVVLCGKSGSGKTSLTRLLNGLIPDYYEGELKGFCQVGDYRTGQDSVENFSTIVGSVFQESASQFFHNIVEHELVFPCENQGLPRTEIISRLEETSRLFELEQVLKKQVNTLSGGQAQRVGLATAYMQKPKVIVLDEPTANLDQDGIVQVRSCLERLKNLGVTLIIAEHRLDYLQELADHYYYFENGQIRYSWDKETWLELSDDYRHQLGLRGLSQPNPPPLAQSSQEQSGLRVAGLDLTVGLNRVCLGRIDDLCFPTDQIVALTGANGTGKTSLAEALAGLKWSNGQCSLAGNFLTHKERLQVTSLVKQDVSLQLFSSSVSQELALGNALLDKDHYHHVVQRLGLENLLERHPMTLSGGEQQRLMVAVSLLSNKQVFIFDEPSSGLDYSSMSCLADLLLELKEENRVIILISHDKDLIAKVCDSQVVLDDKLVKETPHRRG